MSKKTFEIDKPKHAGGRPTKYSHAVLETAKKICVLGATEEQTAEILGVDKATLYRWKKKYPEFCNTLNEAKAIPDRKVEQSLFNRAVGMAVKEESIEEIEGAEGGAKKKITIKELPPDPTSMIFWLKNRRPDIWRDKQVTEHEIPEGAGLVILRGKMGVEEWQQEQKKLTEK